MNKARGLTGLLLLLVLGLGLIGCGGSGGGGLSSANAFAGSYFGSWNNTYVPNYGSSQVAISDSGAITGTIHDSYTNNNGTIVGKVNDSGSYSMTITFAGVDPEKCTGTMSWNHVSHLIAKDSDSNNFDWMAQ
jgi:hypothetical protein